MLLILLKIKIPLNRVTIEERKKLMEKEHYQKQKIKQEKKVRGLCYIILYY